MDTRALDPGAYEAELALRFDPDKPVLARGRASFSVPAASPVGAPPMTQEQKWSDVP